MKIVYHIGVRTPSGYRQVSVLAESVQISAGMAEVTRVIEIDGETPSHRQSITGARRHVFNGVFWAGLEIGKKKRISAHQVLRSIALKENDDDHR